MIEQNKNGVQLIVSIASALSILVTSVSVLSFVQLAERRLTTVEVRLEYLADVIKADKKRP